MIEIEDDERLVLLYWLLRAYASGHREGWEKGPSVDETMTGIHSLLCNYGLDPNLSRRAKGLARRRPIYPENFVDYGDVLDPSGPES
ncbi:hypothetical protein LCGC14_3149480 [marine sediment metagenome]|uniref:Uncharacterized protein n=1 Tax=marine sediment metagenome TaxID=412755 RepID=A0A0F8VUI4_9ZZZZ